MIFSINELAILQPVMHLPICANFDFAASAQWTQKLPRRSSPDIQNPRKKVLALELTHNLSTLFSRCTHSDSDELCD